MADLLRRVIDQSVFADTDSELARKVGPARTRLIASVPDPHAPVFGVVFLLAAQEWTSGSSAVRDDQPGAQVGAVRDHRRARRHVRQDRLAPDMRVRLVAGCRPADATTRRVSASMMTCTFAENR
ncbi:hypothetical protein SVIOM74S_04489 [Streptomyces violarus]